MLLVCCLNYSCFVLGNIIVIELYYSHKDYNGYHKI